MAISYKFGKKAPRLDQRTLQLSSYLDLTALPPIPSCKYWSGGIKNWGMMKNDVLGDCAIATPGHMVMGWTVNALGSPIIIPDKQIVKAYSAVSGYDPKTGANDNGCQVLDVLNYWRKTGIGGHNIKAFASVNPKNLKQVMAATYLFGGVYLGMALPAMLQSLNMMDGDWVLPNPLPKDGSADPYSLGGHAVPIISYDPNWVYIITWGGTRRVSWPFFRMFCDEAFAAISQDWVKPSGISPSGLNMAALMADVKLVAA